MNKTYSTKSWHYRLATKYGNMDTHNVCTDICTYRGKVILGILTALFYSLVGAISTWIAIEPFNALYFYLDYGYETVSPAAGVGLALYSIAALLGCVYIICEKIGPLLSKIQIFQGITKPITDNVIVHAYDSWKNKVCVRIDFQEKIEELATKPHDYGFILPDSEINLEIPVGEEIPNWLIEFSSFVYDFTSETVIKGNPNKRSKEHKDAISNLNWGAYRIYWSDIDRYYLNEEGLLQRHLNKSDEEEG